MSQVVARKNLIVFGLGFSLALSLGLFPTRAQGQEGLSELVLTCSQGASERLSWCREAGLAIQAAQGAVGLAASGGADLPGSASTLGWRTKGSPRFALTVRGGGSRTPLPAMEVRDGIPGGETTSTLYSVTVAGTVGLFDGFSLGPTVGGFASIDLTGSGNWVATPTGDGFQDNALGWGVGARLGILRESFSLPGVSLSVFHRPLGSLTLWDQTAGDPAVADFDLTVSSLRGTIGKDIFGIGFFGGGGFDRYTGAVSLTLTEPATSVETTVGDLESDRPLFFLGASFTFLALQLSGEVGWAGGFDSDLARPDIRGFDPSASSVFGGLGLRLTF